MSDTNVDRRPRRGPIARGTTRTRYLVLWWMSQRPYAALFENRTSAEAAATVRNALMLTIRGHATEIESIVDWYRRDEAGQPMPAEWRELAGKLRPRWTAVPSSTKDAAEIA